MGDKVNDAGGLLREWMHMVIKDMFDEFTGMFQLCNTDDVMYKLKWDEDIDEEFSCELLILFGVILGKAIFEKIPINSYLDRTLLRQLLSVQAEISLADVFGYDKEVKIMPCSCTRVGNFCWKTKSTIWDWRLTSLSQRRKRATRPLIWWSWWRVARIWRSPMRTKRCMWISGKTLFI